MKITPKKYAIALNESLKGKSPKEAKAVLSAFASLVSENGDLGKAERIIAAFSRLYDQKEGIVRAGVKSAFPLDQAALDEIKRYVIARTGARRVETDASLDKGLLGGAVLSYGDKVLDASLKARLGALSAALRK